MRCDQLTWIRVLKVQSLPPTIDNLSISFLGESLPMGPGNLRIVQA